MAPRDNLVAFGPVKAFTIPPIRKGGLENCMHRLAVEHAKYVAIRRGESEPAAMYYDADSAEVLCNPDVGHCVGIQLYTERKK